MARHLGPILTAMMLGSIPTTLLASDPVRPSIGEPVGLSCPPPPAPAPVVVAQTTTTACAWPAEPDGGPNYAGLQGGAALYMLRPYFNNNVAFTSTTGLGTPSPAQEANDFRWNYDPALAAWLGWTGPGGLGVRGRYFHFDESALDATASMTPFQAATSAITAPAGVSNLPGGNFGAPGILLGAGLGQAGMLFASHLAVDAYDLEATWAWQSGRFSMLLSGGGRYLHLGQDYRASLVNNATAGGTALGEVQQLRFDHNFDGGGPILGWFGRYQVGPTGLAVFSTLRTALLVGSSRQNTSFVQKVTDPLGIVGGNQTLAPTRSVNADQTLPVLELELGAEYGLIVGRSRVFVRSGVVSQTYFDAGNAASTSGNFSLFGGQVSLGVNY